MNIDLFTLCDYVSNHNGQLTIIDTFDSLNAEKFPWRAYFGVAVKMDISKNVDKDFNICIYKDGAPEKKLFNVDTPFSSKEYGKFVLAGNIKGLIFEEAGLYHCTLSIGNKVIKDCKFQVNQKRNENEENI